MVVIKNDERTGRFRDRSGSIKAYSKANHIPKVSASILFSQVNGGHFNTLHAASPAGCKPLPTCCGQHTI